MSKVRGVKDMNKGQRGKKYLIKKFLMITLASVVYGAGISLLIDPNDLAPGGVSGLSVVLNRIIPLETGTIYLLINIPIMLLGIWKFGFRFIISTSWAILMISMSTNFFKPMGALTEQPILASIFGGVLSAAGIGYVMREGATTGGTDIIVKCLKLKKPHLKTGSLFLALDIVIILTGGIVFKNADSVLYSLISVAITSVVLDMILYGRDEAKMIFIISNASEPITARILEELDTGVTHLTGSGAYKKEGKQVILCAVKKANAYKVEEIVRQEDSNAFMIISNASEIYGEGYKSYFGERL